MASTAPRGARHWVVGWGEGGGMGYRPSGARQYGVGLLAHCDQTNSEKTLERASAVCFIGDADGTRHGATEDHAMSKILPSLATDTTAYDAMIVDIATRDETLTASATKLSGHRADLNLAALALVAIPVAFLLGKGKVRGTGGRDKFVEAFKTNLVECGMSQSRVDKLASRAFDPVVHKLARDGSNEPMTAKTVLEAWGTAEPSIISCSGLDRARDKRTDAERAEALAEAHHAAVEKLTPEARAAYDTAMVQLTTHVA